MVTVHSSVCVVAVHTKMPHRGILSHTFICSLSGRNYVTYSDLPSGLPTVICWSTVSWHSLHGKPIHRMATSRFFAIMSQQLLLYTKFLGNASTFFIFCKLFFIVFRFCNLIRQVCVAWALSLQQTRKGIGMPNTHAWYPRVYTHFRQIVSGKIYR